MLSRPTLKCCFTLALLLLASSSSYAAKSRDPIAAVEHHQQKLFSRVAPSVVYISSRGGFGSGFFINRSGLVLTNAHVVQDQDEVDVVLHDGTRTRGKVVERAKDDIDLALVQLPVKETTALTLGGLEQLRVGSWVASVGHGMGGIWTLNTGMVSNVYADGVKHPVFQTQIPLNPGNSGGPVLDREGRVVGVVTKGMADSNAINFAIRSDVAIRSLSGLSSLGASLLIETAKGVPVFVDGKMVGEGPRIRVQLDPGDHEVFAVLRGKLRKRKISFPEVQRVRLR